MTAAAEAVLDRTMIYVDRAVGAARAESAVRVARRLRDGQVPINDGAFNPAAPFGGYKHSGLGREAGAAGLEEFLETKAIQR